MSASRSQSQRRSLRPKQWQQSVIRSQRHSFATGSQYIVITVNDVVGYQNNTLRSSSSLYTLQTV